MAAAAKIAALIIAIFIIIAIADIFHVVESLTRRDEIAELHQL